MYKKLSFMIIVCILVCFSASTSIFASPTDFGKYSDASGNLNITDETVSNKDIFFAGSTVTAKSMFDSTTFFAGNSITLDGEYNGDVFVTGNIITINGQINGNLYAAGNSIVVNGVVSKDAFFACSSLTLSEKGIIDRDLFIGASTVSLNGTVGRNLRCGSDTTTINGTINGYVESETNNLIIQDNATITGEINNKSKNAATVSDKAVAPSINWEKVDVNQENQSDNQSGNQITDNEKPNIGAIFLSMITKIGFMMVVWLFITFLAKGFSKNSSTIVKKHSLASLGLGAAFLFVSPLLIILSFIIYVPFGIAMTLLIIASLIFAMPIAVFVFSKLFMKVFVSKMNPLLNSFVSLLIIGLATILIGYIPILSIILGLGLAIFGVGFVIYNILFVTKLENEKINESQIDYNPIEQIEEPIDQKSIDKTDDSNNS